MSLDFLTPSGALLALAVLLPLAAFIAISRRAARVRGALRLPELSTGRRLVPLIAVLAVAGLLGSAAAQPVLENTTSRRVRSDAEVLIVIDISRSMLAQRRPGAPTRLERAKATALRLRASLPGVKVGLASLTNRVLPYVFPSADEDVFRATLERAVDIERPPPGSGLFPELQALRNATVLAALTSVADRRFYSPSANRRLVVVLTDGESPQVSEGEVGRSLREARIETIFLQFWAADERVFTNGKQELRYEPDPAARATLDRLAVATDGSVYDERSLGAAVRKAREVIGSGPTVIEGDRPDRIALAPYLAFVAFLPLTILLWRRDR